MSKLEFRSLNKRFADFHAIKDVTLKIDEGELVVFVGPSGCGKSTMLRLIAGLEDITSGELLIDGEVANNWVPVKRKVAMVFQSYALYPNMTVAGNIAFGLQQAKLPKDEIKKLVSEASATLKLDELLDRRPSQLSGGQSQRVAIGRAIVRKPGIFLFDEPLSNLDAELRVHMRVELVALHQRIRKTMIYVTHDQVEAMTMAHRIVVFNLGAIEQVGTPLELYNSPANDFVAGFIGSPKMNFFEETGRQGDAILVPGGQFTTTELTQGGLPPKIKIGIRPEHMQIGLTGDMPVTGKVELVERLGSESFVYVDVGLETALVARISGQVAPNAGETIGLGPLDGLTYLFDANDGACVSDISSKLDETKS